MHVTLPAMTAEGLLPPSRHTATLPEVYQRFVLDAPNPGHRVQTFRALLVHLERLVMLAGPGKVWLDGGFTTHKVEPPGDVDLVYLCRDGAHLDGLLHQDAVFELLTLQNVVFEYPVMRALDRLQPMAGHVNAFFAAPAVGDGYGYWDGLWSTVKGRPGAVKGYVELEVTQ